MVNIKDEVRQLLEHLPDDLTWEELLDRIYVRKTIAAGLADSEEGRTSSVEEVRREFGLEP